MGLFVGCMELDVLAKHIYKFCIHLASTSWLNTTHFKMTPYTLVKKGFYSWLPTPFIPGYAAGNRSSKIKG